MSLALTLTRRQLAQSSPRYGSTFRRDTRIPRPCFRTRTFSTQSLGPLTAPVEYLSRSFLDLGAFLSTLPLPEALPPYSATIILVTLALRTGITLPVSVWARRRMTRLKEVARPEIKDAQRTLARKFRKDSEDAGTAIDQERFKEFQKANQPLLKKITNDIYKKHNCKPLPTILTPILTHLPIFILYSFTLRQAALPPTPLLAETFLSEASLAIQDPIGIFPIMLGMTSLANVELGKYFFSEKKERSQVEKTMDFIMRGASLAIIGVAGLTPTAVTLYWCTSSLFTLTQTIVLGTLEKRRLALRPPAVPEEPVIRFRPQALSTGKNKMVSAIRTK